MTIKNWWHIVQIFYNVVDRFQIVNNNKKCIHWHFDGDKTSHVRKMFGPLIILTPVPLYTGLL